MATSGDIVCGVCEVEHITKDAEYWCPECEQGLCSNCLRYHKALKSSRNHCIISIDNYKQLPPFIINIKQYCPDHDRKFTNYCPQHESLCCPLCIPANHKECHGISAVEEIIQSSKTSTLLQSMEQNLNDIKSNMNKIIENKKQNLASIKSHKQKFRDEIKQMREKINKHLDKLEQQILHDLSAQEENAKLQIESILTNVFENTERVDMLQNNITTVKQYASDLQTFLGTKTIQDEVQKQEKEMHSILDDRSVNEVVLKCNLDDKITEILCTISSFGKVYIELGQPLVVIKMDKGKQAQIVYNLPAQPKTIDDITLVLQWKTNLKEKGRMTFIAGACINTSTGDIILTDYQDRLLILNQDGSIHKKIPLSFSFPADVTFIDDRTVAVSTHETYCIHIIDIRDNASKRIINTTNCCSGISYRHGFLLYAEHNKGICKVQLPNSGQTLLIPKMANNHWDYLAMSDDKIYHTMYRENKVCCYTMSGEKIWEYNDKTILKNPIGVSFDKSSNIYVASNGNNTIIVISSEGNSARCILGKEDGIGRPFGMCIDIERNSLLVSSNDGTVVLYKLT
ncbi:protein wech-like [Mytilus edulis]|uniref:protein wech-like n=1 Tax=Mytilus edulis TaxID=6550 RepID=UPI0039F08B93